MKRYLLEIFLLSAFILICVGLYNSRKSSDQKEGYARKLDSLSSVITEVKKVNDSLKTIEQKHETKIITINRYFDSTKTNIYYLSDSATFLLLRANIQGHAYLLDH